MMPSNVSFEESVVFRLGSLTLTTTTEAISPVTLNSDWSRVAKLLLLTALSVTGSVGNVFMISSVMIENHLKKRGEKYFAKAKNQQNDSELKSIFFFNCSLLLKFIFVFKFWL